MKDVFAAPMLAVAFVLGAAIAVGASQNQPATGTITGIVTDAQSHQPVRGAQVMIQGAALRTMTDTSGRYTIGGVAPGVVNVVVQRNGYIAEAFRAIGVVAGQTTTRDLVLRPAAPNAFRFIPIAPGVGAGSPSKE